MPFFLRVRGERNLSEYLSESFAEGGLEHPRRMQRNSVQKIDFIFSSYKGIFAKKSVCL